jgi:uncharacterized protein (TIGR00369 family)
MKPHAAQSGMLESIRDMLATSSTPPPIAELIGFTMNRADIGLAVIEFEAQHRHANPMGTLHGGVMCDVADAAMGMAYATTLAMGESFTTLELKINFIRPFWTGKLLATGRVVTRGSTVGLVECELEDHRGRLVAKASSTCMTLRNDQTKGRGLTPCNAPNTQP